MFMPIACFGTLLALAPGSSGRIQATDEAPLLGPSFIANFDPTNSTAIEEAKAAFPVAINELFELGVLNKTDLIFSIDIFSAATNRSIYNYRHVGDGQEAAISKLITTYAILAHAGIGIFNDPITNYIPELRACNQSYNLLTHAGSGGAADSLPADRLPTRQEFLTYMRASKHPVMAPFHSSTYSDGGYGILTILLERLTGLEYPDAVQTILNQPLNLTDLVVGAPNGSDINVIDRRPIDSTSSWGLDIPVVAGSGGVYAHSADVRAIGLSILNSELLSPVTTRQWMRPLSGTGSLVELVGAPWEIQRLMLPTTGRSNRTRISDLYTKAGGNGDYTAIIGLSPDHGIGFSILVAGSSATSARWPIRDTVGEVFLPAAEAAAAENAARNIAGIYTSATEGNNITLTVNDNYAGLGIESFYYDGVNGVPLLAGADAGADANISFRLYPTGINSFSHSLATQYKTNGTFFVAHRAVAASYPLFPRAAADGGEGGLFDRSFAWSNVDFVGPVDEVIFELVNGRVEGLRITATNMDYRRVE
ncbi:hypothetical protein S40285_07413 [Stachybotrys chlorohalonatus IBT 40285]|uniref:Uncharacterized protein n=1 Tax=Stachybotrys chlorohalonatus (strain IBT 40285) TaxID=1283841 RepID=A0A084QZ74_STAC4|nr:hypothetical protein S40285_07413 [Stachybotrys chlorohalonata IBT 40285]